MTYTEAYKILGLAPNATEKEIIKAFRKTAFNSHKDYNGSVTDAAYSEKMRRIIEAKEFLISGHNGAISNAAGPRPTSAQNQNTEEYIKEQWEKHYRENMEYYLRNNVKSYRNIFCAVSTPLATLATIIAAMEIAAGPVMTYDAATIPVFVLLGAFCYGFPAFNIKWWIEAKKSLKEYLKTKNTAIIKYKQMNMQKVRK